MLVYQRPPHSVAAVFRGAGAVKAAPGVVSLASAHGAPQSGSGLDSAVSKPRQVRLPNEERSLSIARQRAGATMISTGNVIFQEEHMDRKHAERVLFEQLKRTVPIEAVLARYGIELQRQGNSLKGRCPIHKGSNPTQFVVSNNLWRCFSPSCDRGGDVLALVAELEKIDVKDAAMLIAEWFCVMPSSDVQHRKPKEKAMSGEKPSHKAYVVEDKPEGSDEKGFWTRVGSAWPHGDGKGLNVQLASGVSVSGRLVLREYTEDDAEEDKKRARKK